MSPQIRKYDKDFAHAMSLKLRMSRENKRVNDNECRFIKGVDELRAIFIKNTLEQRPGLTFKQASQMMNELGF